MAETPDMIPFDDFAKVDLRAATVTNAVLHPNADKLLLLTLDDGTEGGRQVCAGVRPWYPDPSVLVGRQVAVVANLEPRTIRGQESQGMVLAATSGAGEAQDVVLLALDRPVEPGSKIS